MQDDPERQVQVEVRACEQRIGVRAHRVERDVAEVEQAGEANDDVETQRQQDVENREVGDAHPGRAHRGEHERQHGQGDGNEQQADLWCAAHAQQRDARHVSRAEPSGANQCAPTRATGGASVQVVSS